MKKEREVYADKESAMMRLRNNGISIDTAEKLIMVDKRRPPGIKLWGAIDYLKHFAGYDWGWAS